MDSFFIKLYIGEASNAPSHTLQMFPDLLFTADVITGALALWRNLGFENLTAVIRGHIGRIEQHGGLWDERQNS